MVQYGRFFIKTLNSFMGEYTLITGASSGLGFQLAKLFAKDKNNLLLISSNEDNLKHAKEELEKEVNVDIQILAVDLSDRSKFKIVKEFTNKNQIFIFNLVNCAGFGDRTDFVEMDIDKQMKMVELNCNAPMYLMHAYLKDMIAAKEGHILNISSIAAFVPGPYMCTYHASKAFLTNLSEGIARELKGTGVKLTTVCPGPFESGFVSKAGNEYTFSKIKPMSVQKVAEISYKCLKKNKSFKVIGFKNKLMMFMTRFSPRKLVTNTSANQIKNKAHQ